MYFSLELRAIVLADVSHREVEQQSRQEQEPRPVENDSRVDKSNQVGNEGVKSQDSHCSAGSSMNQSIDVTLSISELMLEELKRFHRLQEEKAKSADLQSRIIADSQVFGALSVVVSYLKSIHDGWLIVLQRPSLSLRFR